MMNSYLNSSHELLSNLSYLDDQDVRQCGGIKREVQEMLAYVVGMCLSSIVCYIGAISNAFAIIIFIKLGFKNSINISLANIAFWDLLKCTCGAVIKLYGPIALSSNHFSLNWKTITRYILGNVYRSVGYASTFLTAYVAVERCLCVSLPFTVKFLLTRKVVISVNLISSVLAFLIHAPTAYLAYDYKFVRNEETNITLAVLYRTPLYDTSISAFSSMTGLLAPTLSWVIMIICTIIIAIFLTKASKVRSNVKRTSEGDEKTSHLSLRDRQVIKMLLASIAVHIVTSFPKIVFFVMTYSLPEFTIVGCFSKYFMFLANIMGFMDYVNAAANPFIFYSMSSAFKSVFLTMFQCRKSMNTFQKELIA